MSTNLKDDLRTLSQHRDAPGVYARAFLSLMDRVRDLDRNIDSRLAGPKKVHVLIYTQYGVNEGADVIAVYASSKEAEEKRYELGDGYSVSECDFRREGWKEKE